MPDLGDLFAEVVFDSTGRVSPDGAETLAELSRRLLSVSEAVNESLLQGNPPKLAWRIRRIVDGRE